MLYGQICQFFPYDSGPQGVSLHTKITQLSYIFIIHLKFNFLFIASKSSSHLFCSVVHDRKEVTLQLKIILGDDSEPY